MEIDILVASSSRLRTLKKTIESINFKWSGTFRWILHEDIMNYKDSSELLQFALKGFNVIGCHFPRLRMMGSIRWLLDQSKSKYVFLILDDLPWIKPVDVDLIIKNMEEHPEINTICFNTRPTMAKLKWVGDYYISENKTIGDLRLATLPYFNVTNSIFRRDFVDKIITDGTLTWREFMAIHKNSTQGSYFMGHIGEGHYTNAIVSMSHRMITDSMAFGNYTYIQRQRGKL